MILINFLEKILRGRARDQIFRAGVWAAATALLYPRGQRPLDRQRDPAARLLPPPAVAGEEPAAHGTVGPAALARLGAQVKCDRV